MKGFCRSTTATETAIGGILRLQAIDSDFRLGGGCIF
jgi:hypothetical protein